MFSLFEIERVVFVFIGLSLEGNATISLLPVPIQDKPDKPFCAVPKKEEYDKHLFLLLTMNTLVPLDALVVAFVLADKDEWPYRHGCESLKRNVFIHDLLHIKSAMNPDLFYARVTVAAFTAFSLVEFLDNVPLSPFKLRYNHLSDTLAIIDDEVLLTVIYKDNSNLP